MNYFKTTVLTGLALFTLSTHATHNVLTTEEKARAADSEIAAMLVMGNELEIDAGRMAKRKTDNAEVRAFAERMISNHKAGNKQVKDVTKRLKISTANTEQSREMKKDFKADLRLIKKLKGNQFDAAYINFAVTTHMKKLNKIDSEFLPKAQNLEFKSLIEQIRPGVAAHLQHAKEIQAKLNTSTAKR